MALLRAHAEDPVPRAEGMPDSLWTLLCAMLAKSPDDRPTATVSRRCCRSWGVLVGDLGPFDITEAPATLIRPIPRSDARQPSALPSHFVTTSPGTLDRPPEDRADGVTIISPRRVLTGEVHEALTPPVQPEQPPRRRRRVMFVCSSHRLRNRWWVPGYWSVRQRHCDRSHPNSYSFVPVAYSDGTVVTRQWELNGEDGDRAQLQHGDHQTRA